ncbi:putative phosphonate transport system ATP-binding protein [Desulfuromusa kysingii]|uniref:Putative phosphonate transport system ATP-binding protein n=1 Tax=Desulfuromusa kysingii TaxID=37625 RepID=A0A1H3ZWK7_9BACT|nr:ATP-binding cassette domain-containing protein [Desulfuromusa kysingii]SEA28045.1 putative phosphonate transport system ATP-binding protein [Desulfuromusa kysingii]
MEALLKARRLSKIFGPGCSLCNESTGPDFDTNVCPHCHSVVACNAVDFDLYPGEVLGIVGESGSGKSTLIKLAHFEWSATDGEMTLHRSGLPAALAELLADKADQYTCNLFGLSQFQQRQVRNALMGIVYQNPLLGLRMNVSSGGNIAERLLGAGWRHIGKMCDRASELLEKTEIPISRMDEPPKNFSGGMQQRVQIAKALSNNPLLLLLDEVTTGLDLSVQARVLDLIRSLQREFQLSMLVVSHDLGVINLLCNRTMVMKHGRVVESGLTDQILQDPQHGYTQLLVASQL